MFDDQGNFSLGDYQSLLSSLLAAGVPMGQSGGGDYSGLDWGGAASLVPMGRASWDPSSEPDATKSGRAAFNATDPQTAALLAKLSGNSADPLTTLAQQGYSVGVGHQPGTSPGGRQEYYGLIDPNGKYVQGQGAPTMTMSDTMMDNITPFLMMAGPFLSAAGAIGAGAEAGAGVSTLGGTADGVTALGSAWSPQALGLTGAIAPGTTAAELAGLSAGLPELGAGVGAAGGASMLGGGGSGVSALGSAWSPEALGLTGGITPGVSAGELAGLSQGIPGAVGAGGAAGSSIGNSGGMSSADKGAMYGNDGYGAGMSGTQTSAYDSVLGATGSKGAADLVANSGIGSGLLDGVKSAADLVGGGQNLAGLIGAGLGAASGGGAQTAGYKMDPRMEALLYGSGQGDTSSLFGAARQQFLANPSGLNSTMQQGLDMQRQALQDPAYGQAYTQMRSLGSNLMSQPVAGNPFTGGAMPGQGGGLLGQQPMSQAGGAGGLLGNGDRMKTLMARGRGLVG